jgi:diaminopimelate decarboxylase
MVAAGRDSRQIVRPSSLAFWNDVNPDDAPAFSFGPDGWACEGLPLAELASRFGTPLYCYGRARLLANYQRLAAAFPEPSVLCYSVKANPNLAILRELANAGAGFDVVSHGELWRVLRAGGSASRTVFAGVGKTAEALRAAVDAGLFMLNVESVGELRQLLELARGRKPELPVAIRVNPDVDPQTHRFITTGKRENKFGIERSQFPQALELLKGASGVRLAGLHVHIGSQVESARPYAEALERLLELVRAARAQGFEPEWLNLGGGFALAYDGRDVPAFDDYAAAVRPALEAEGLKLVLEIGRSIVGDAGGLVTRVLYEKQPGDRRLLITDAGMNDLLRPALYGAWHRIWPIVRPPAEAGASSGGADPLTPADVAGPICESSDYFAFERDLPPVTPGDCLLVFDAGAYGMSMASQYNSHPRPAEVMVDRGRARLIRRRETFEDLIVAEEEVESPPPGAS